MKRAAIVYVIEDQLLIVSAPETTAGTDIMRGLTTLSREAGRDAIGASIQQALVGSEGMAPRPTEAEWRASHDVLLAAAGISDLKKFILAATMFHISVDGEQPVTVERVEKPADNNEIAVPQGEDGFLGSDIGGVIADAVEWLYKNRASAA